MDNLYSVQSNSFKDGSTQLNGTQCLIYINNWPLHLQYPCAVMLDKLVENILAYIGLK